MIHEVTTYKDLLKWSDAFVNGSFGLFFLVGNPGHGKSYTIRKLLNESIDKAKRKAAANLLKQKKGSTTTDSLYMPVTGQPRPANHKPYPLWIEGGNISAFKLFQRIYEHLDQTLILDDTDEIYSERAIVRLLKSVCQTEEVKEISWTTQSKQLEAEGIPSSYKCRNRVCIIANHWHELNQHVGSLTSRGVMIDFKPSIDEVFRYVKANNIIKYKDILDFVSKNLWLAQKIDIRVFKLASEAKKAGLPWKDAVSKSLGCLETLLIHEMNTSGKYTNEEQKATNFKAVTGLSRPKFFDFKKQLEAIMVERDADKPVTKRRMGVNA